MPEIVARIRQTVGVIDPEGVDIALGIELDEEAVGRGEHVGILDADRGERADVEESPVVQLFVGHLPVGQPVVLALDEDAQRQ